MLFNSTQFLIFFPIVVLLYFVIPAKLRQFWLLVSSYYFYMNWNPGYAVLIFTSTVLTWLCGLLIERQRSYAKLWVVLCVTSNLLILFVFKYLNWGIETWNLITGSVVPTLDLLLPVGISFYTFQALGYSIDVYRGDVDAEHNIVRYALFVSFFPQLVAGPIERSGNLLKQIRQIPTLSRKQIISGTRIRNGLILMVWGMFLKLVIADRVSTLVDTVFGRYYVYGTVPLMLGAIGFALQIYCDFASYSTIAIGAAKVMGFELMENFNTPYMSMSITEFWRRWHISLSSWFRDYLYIPLGGNRKGFCRKLLNLLITFTVSGLWHGANWTFIVWGALHGIYLMIENIIWRIWPNTRKIGKKSFGNRACHAILTFLLVDFAWIFFRADSLKLAVKYISRMAMRPDWWMLTGGRLFTLGLNVQEAFILLIGMIFLFLVDYIRYTRHEQIDIWLSTQGTAFRIIAVMTLVLFTMVFGVYGPGFDSKQFLYFQF